LKNTKETIEEYEKKYRKEKRRAAKEEQEEIPGRFMTKVLYE